MFIRLIFLLAFPFLLQAQSADEIIKKLQNEFAKVQTLKADFRQTIYSTQSMNSISFEGEFYYKKENSFAITLPDREIISDGKSIWNFDKKLNKVVISTYDKENLIFSLNDIIYSYPAKCNLILVNTEGNDYLIKAVPIDMELNFKEAYLSINNNFILNKIEIIDFNNMKYIFELFSTIINPKIEDKKFHFSPSSQVEVIDLR